eukprot:1299888-Pleurochrysis_carterae.AAC.2
MEMCALTLASQCACGMRRLQFSGVHKMVVSLDMLMHVESVGLPQVKAAALEGGELSSLQRAGHRQKPLAPRQ